MHQEGTEIGQVVKWNFSCTFFLKNILHLKFKHIILILRRIFSLSLSLFLKKQLHSVAGIQDKLHAGSWIPART